MIRVVIPSQLESYTAGAREVTLADELANPTLLDAINALDARFPHLKFRIVDEQENIRRHIAIFVGEELVRDLQIPLAANARIQIVGALSGG